MISVIIPALNEERTIGKVVEIAKSSNNVDEVIVVDDKSVDDTVKEAKKAGASVIISTKIGKGASMRDGLLVAKNEIVVYLDADVENYHQNVIEDMTYPLVSGEADFVKATFSRDAGRVTELVARPLLSLLFPEALQFSQPLSGMISGRRIFLEKVTFEDDYGVDIGILLDMITQSARIVEVKIGNITHKMKPWRELSRMSREVSKAILTRAQGRPGFSLDSLETINVIRDQVEFAIKESITALKKMAIFDMDHTLLQNSFIHQAAEEFNFKKQLLDILASNEESFLITKLIARNLKGLNIQQLLSIVDRVPLVPETLEVVKELKSRGYIVGIITDSYDFVAQHVKNKIGVDFALANELEFNNSIATGEVKIPSFFMRTEKSRCQHNFCKSNVMMKVAGEYGIELSNVIAVGDSEYDICMVRFAGIGVAFCSQNHILNSIADYQINTPSFKEILDFAG